MKLVRWTTLVKDTRGANMVEYIILVGVIAILAMAGFSVFGSNVKSKINDQASVVSNITSSS
jgi:Flp pilus assembly pilin Flp